jgi:membrane protease YdiL (CAAX protease family)
MSLPWKYLILCFVLTWLIWIPGTLLHADVMILTFGSAGPALAAVWLARCTGKSSAQPSRRFAYFAAIWLTAWLALEIAPPGGGGLQWPMRWNPWTIPLAMLPAWILSGAWSSDRGIREFGRTMWTARDWWWPLVSFLAIPAYLLIPAGIAGLVGLPLTAPPRPNGLAALAASGAASFARNFLFTAVFEEPGWRGTLLRQLEYKHSPLTASLLVWFPWMLWHAPLDLSGGAAHTVAGWLQIRVIFLIPMTILLTWIYNRSGRSLLCTSLFHSAMNTFPFVLPWSPPMLGLVFAWVIWVVIQDRMWRRKILDDSWIQGQRIVSETIPRRDT